MFENGRIIEIYSLNLNFKTSVAFKTCLDCLHR